MVVPFMQLILRELCSTGGAQKKGHADKTSKKKQH